MSVSSEIPGRAMTGSTVRVASPVLQDIAVAVAFLTYAVGFFVILSQPLASVPSADVLAPATLGGLAR